MGLFLICPHCHRNLPLASRKCLACGADLRVLAPADRRYFIGDPAAPETAAAASPEMYPEPMPPAGPGLETKDVSLCEALDRVLNKGAVLFGEVMISVADIDLVYLGLQVILASMETARGRGLVPLGAGQGGTNILHPGAPS
jgi:hypothetical protein